ncbi:DUF4055 domain-containing protein, partial [Tardiphaga sp.]|uniref:DUF4055 domain-containing protein n=1 Tax=Tardiphaga sp. TaxID=1926292 RepID=UPI0037D9F8AC
RKDPTFEKDEGIKDILKDVTLSGVPFNAFAEDVLREALIENRAGVLVDFPTVQKQEGEVITLDVAARKGLRVYATKYVAESIINWRTEQVGGKTVLSMVVLQEEHREIDPKNAFAFKCSPQFRVLLLDGGKYRQEIWRNVEKKENRGKKGTVALTKVADYFPLKNGAPLDYIPFVFFGAKGNDTCVEDPLLYDLAMVNLAHYRNDADLEHGLHFTGLPTPVVTGISNTNDTYRIGSCVAWGFENPEANAFYLEFKGEGLGQLRTGKKDKEEQMAALGARMLSPEKKDAESADALAQKRQGENSALGGLANSCARSFSLVLTMMADWAGKAADVVVKLNTDYIPAAMPPEQIRALLEAVVSGNMSKETFFEAMVKGEVIAPGRTYEEEQSRIAEDVASNPNPQPLDDDEQPPRREAA